MLFFKNIKSKTLLITYQPDTYILWSNFREFGWSKTEMAALLFWDPLSLAIRRWVFPDSMNVVMSFSMCLHDGLDKEFILLGQSIARPSRILGQGKFYHISVFNFFICLQHKQQQQQQHQQQQQQQQTGLLRKCSFFVTYTFCHSQGDPTDLLDEQQQQ